MAGARVTIRRGCDVAVDLTDVRVMRELVTDLPAQLAASGFPADALSCAPA
jgi:hypothetical protein